MTDLRRSNLLGAIKKFLLGRGCVALSGILSLFLQVRLLSPEDIAIYVAILSYVEVYVIASSFGVNSIADRQISIVSSRYAGQEGRQTIINLLFWRFAFSFLFSAFAIILCLIAASYLSSYRSLILMMMMIHLLIGFEATARFIESAFESLGMQGRSQVSQVTRAILKLGSIFVIYIWFGSADLIELIMIDGVIYLMVFFVAFILFVRVCPLHGFVPKSPYEDSVISTSAIKIYWSGLIACVSGLDGIKMLAPMLLKTADAATFAVCSSLVGMISRYVPTALFVGIIRPIIIRRSEDSGVDGFREIFKWFSVFNVSYMGLVLGVLLDSPDALLDSVSGYGSTSGGIIFSWLILGVMLNALRALYSHACLGLNAGRQVLVAQFFSVFVSLVCVGFSCFAPQVLFATTSCGYAAWLLWVKVSISDLGSILLKDAFCTIFVYGLVLGWMNFLWPSLRFYSMNESLLSLFFSGMVTAGISFTFAFLVSRPAGSFVMR